MVTASLGILLGFATVALPQLKLNEDESSWFASIDLFCLMVFAPLGGALSGWLGRKKILMIFSPVAALGWLLIAQSKTITILFVGRFLSSVALASMLASPNVYISETAHPDIRATLASLPGFADSIGISSIWILGHFVSWRTIAYFAILPFCLLFPTFCFLPETPYWLVENGLEEPAQKSLQFFRSSVYYDIDQEMSDIQQKYLEKKVKMKSQSFQRILSPAFLKPFTCIGIINVLTILAGFAVLANYVSEFMTESGSDIDPTIGPMVIGWMRLVIALIVPFFVQKMNPKISFSIGQFIKASAMLVIAIYFHLLIHAPEVTKNVTWIPMVMFILQFCVRSIAIMPVLYSLLGELFPTDIRTLSVGIIQSLEFGSAALIVKMYPDMKHVMGMYGICYLYASLGFCNSFWGYCTIPDNRSKSLIEIEEAYQSTSPLNMKRTNK